ncbi:unnamed protein product, partial [Ilex paraguariensis]
LITLDNNEDDPLWEIAAFIEDIRHDFQAMAADFKLSTKRSKHSSQFGCKISIHSLTFEGLGD